MDAEPLSAKDFVVYLEKVTEPYTGTMLLGLGGYAPITTGLLRIEVCYDGETASVARMKVIDSESRVHFTTQLPFESDVGRISVVACDSAGELVLRDVPTNEIGQREETIAVANNGIAFKLINIAKRGGKSIVSGQIFSPRRWWARANRVTKMLLRIKQKIRTKLLLRRFPGRSVHDAFIANTATVPDDVRFAYRPKISILLPVYNVESKWFLKAVQSVRDQHYDNWELCIVDDCSTDPQLRKAFAQLSDDARIHVVARTENGHICAATNSAADLATGEFIALLDHDDLLAPHALFEIVRRLQTKPEADILYSDEDKIDADERRYDPQFKPDWSPELLLSYNYVNHFTCIRMSLFESVGRYRIGYEGSQDHDLLLRATECTDRVEHIPKILYHWRALPSSTATAAGVKTYVHRAGRLAVEDALRRRGVRATLEVPAFARKLGLPILQLAGTSEGPSVAVIVRGATNDAMRAIEANTDYRNFTVYSETPGAEDYLLFIDAGVVPRSSNWLSKLMAYATLPGVGAVGARIVDPHGVTASAGIVLGMHDGIAPASAFCGLPENQVSYYFYAEVSRNVAAVGDGCLLTSRTAFEQVGGFDDLRFPHTMRDVDYCSRIRAAGFRCVSVGGVELQVSEVVPRRNDPLELDTYFKRNGRSIDPYANPNCSSRTPFEPANDNDNRMSWHAATREPLRVLVGAHNLNSPEGAPRYLSEIILGLQARHALTPSILSPLGGAGEAVYAAASVPTTILNEAWSRRFVDGRWSPREYEAAQVALRKQLKNQQLDVVVANTLLTFPLIEAAARLGIPSVWIIHESYSTEHLRRLFPTFAKDCIESAFRLASRVVPASHDTATLFRHLDFSKNFRIIHNGIEPKPFDEYCRRVTREDAARQLPGDRTKKRILSVGTVCERKGQHTLIEAAAILSRTRNDFVCDLVGVRDSVPYASYVCELVRRNRLENVVNLVTETDRVWPFYRAADIFACTSHMETFSRSILEAEAFGLPIVSTPCEGIAEQVYWGFNALRFEIGDANRLATQIARFLDDDEFRKIAGLRSRAAFDNHQTYDEMLDQYETTLRSVANVRNLQPVQRVAARRAA